MSGKRSAPRKMTAREKAERERIRRELRKEGLLPPVKKLLNRKKFCEEAREIFQADFGFDFPPYVFWAIAEMLDHTDKTTGTLSREAVGAAKVLKLAKARMDFEAARRERGESSEYKRGELIEVVEDIYNA